MHYTLDYYISRNPAKTTRQTVSKKEICLVAAVYDSEIKDFFFIICDHLSMVEEVNFNFVKGKNNFSDNIERFNSRISMKSFEVFSFKYIFRIFD